MPARFSDDASAVRPRLHALLPQLFQTFEDKTLKRQNVKIAHFSTNKKTSRGCKTSKNRCLENEKKTVKTRFRSGRTRVFPETRKRFL